MLPIRWPTRRVQFPPAWIGGDREEIGDGADPPQHKLGKPRHADARPVLRTGDRPAGRSHPGGGKSAERFCWVRPRWMRLRRSRRVISRRASGHPWLVTSIISRPESSANEPRNPDSGTAELRDHVGSELPISATG